MTSSVLLGLALVHTSAAQTTFSTVRGTVTDASGAVVPGVDIVLTDKLTNVKRTTVADNLGNFEIPDLKPGTYRLEAQVTGFKTFVADNIILESSQIRRIDALLEVGVPTQEVTVNASAAVINSEESKLSAALAQETYENAPTAGVDRANPHMVLAMLPGIQTGASGFTLSIAGNTDQIQEGMDGFSYDGSVNQIHHMEDVEELKVVTMNNTAEFARAGYYSMVYQRGKNPFHGDVYYLHDNSALNARPFFVPKKAPYKLHMFGAQASGRIVRDRTFFFVGYNGYSVPAASWNLRTVPTGKMRTGDFSELLALASPIVLRDPVTRQPFSGNVIPASRLNPLSLKAQSLYMPEPNLGTPGTLTQNFGWMHNYASDFYKADYLTTRIDHTLFKDNELFGRISQNWIPYVLTNTMPKLGWTRERYAWNIVISDTHVFSPKFVHTFRFGWDREYMEDGGTVDGYAPIKGDQAVAELGLQGVNPKGLSSMGFPQMAITGFSTLASRAGGPTQHENNLGYADSINWSIGRHTIKFGGELRTFSWFDGSVPNGAYGNFNFNGQFTGYGYGDFLLGIPYTSNRIDPLVGQTRKGKEFGLYVTDTFKATRNLTLDYGLRWDYFPAGKYEDGLQYNWDPQTGNVIIPDAAFSRLTPLYPTNLITVVKGEVLGKADKRDFAPRFGLAYRLGDATVFRGGYGVFTEFTGGEAGHYRYAYSGSPFALSETFINSIVNGAPLFAFPNPFPAGSGTVPSQSVSGYDRDVKTGYIQQFNVTIERQVRDIGFQFSYVGSRGRGLNYSLSLNKPQASLTPFSASRRPFPQFVSTSFARRDGSTNYDALTVRAVKKVGQIAFDTHWTWAHNFANYLNLQDPYNPLHWNQAAINPRHRAVVNLAWRVPVGRGQSHWSQANAVLDHIFGSWSLSWVAFFQTGQFFSPSFSGSDPSNTNTVGGIPDRIADGNKAPEARTLAEWFDVSAFRVPPAGRYGNSGVNILEGPGLHTHNAGLSKNFKLGGERFKLEYVMSVTNLFNHPNFGVPNSNISVPSRGIVTTQLDSTWNMEKAGARTIEMRLRLKW